MSLLNNDVACSFGPDGSVCFALMGDRENDYIAFRTQLSSMQDHFKSTALILKFLPPTSQTFWVWNASDHDLARQILPNGASVRVVPIGNHISTENRINDTLELVRAVAFLYAPTRRVSTPASTSVHNSSPMNSSIRQSPANPAATNSSNPSITMPASMPTNSSNPSITMPASMPTNSSNPSTTNSSNPSTTMLTNSSNRLSLTTMPSMPMNSSNCQLFANPAHQLSIIDSSNRQSSANPAHQPAIRNSSDRQSSANPAHQPAIRNSSDLPAASTTIGQYTETTRDIVERCFICFEKFKIRGMVYCTSCKRPLCINCMHRWFCIGNRERGCPSCHRIVILRHRLKICKSLKCAIADLKTNPCAV